MKKLLTQTIDIPSGIEVIIEGDTVTCKGNGNELIRRFDLGALTLSKKDNVITLHHAQGTKREKKLMNTIKSHLENMIHGVQEPYTYVLKICFSHFPITVDIKGDKAIIKNFLGEKVARKAVIPSGVHVEATKTDIILTSPDKELAGQAAANFEQATKIRGRDRRVFQDGIFIISKAGREL